MITLRKLEVYYKYKGDGDVGLMPSLRNRIMTDLPYEDWSTIKDFIQSIRMVKNGMASISFQIELDVKLRENCENESVIYKLKNMASDLRVT